MHGVKDYIDFWWRSIKMLKRWITPTSPFVATIAFIVMVVGAIAWLVSKIFPKITFVATLTEASGIIFWAGFGFLLLMLIFWIPYKQWRDAFPDIAESQKQHPNMYVFPYVRSVNASPVNAGERYLELSVFFPSSLIRQVNLKLKAQLILSGMCSESSDEMQIYIGGNVVSRLMGWHIPLTEQMLKFVKESVEKNAPVRISLRLQDMSDNRYRWETEEWTTLLLTRVS